MRTVRSQASLRPLVVLTAALVIAALMLTPTAASNKDASAQAKKLTKLSRINHSS
jgi:hypothetical protein